MSINEVIGKMNSILDHISSSKKDYTLYLDSIFTSFRYERKMEELILDALARYIFSYIETSKSSNEKCCSLVLVKESNKTQSNKPQSKISISKILISVNNQQFNDDFIYSNKNMLDNLLTNNFKGIFKVNSNWFDIRKNKIIEYINDEKLKVKLNKKNIENFEGSKEFIQAILDSIQNSEINILLYDELLQFLRSIMDIYLITLFDSYYSLENNPNIDLWNVPNKLNNISPKSGKLFHSESKLAVYCACKLDRDNINEYIGVSKLCCPLCANLLYQLQFKFRGSHSSFSSSIYWRLLYSIILENTDLDKIKEHLNKFSTLYLEPLKSELEKLKTIEEFEDKIDLNEHIYRLTRPQSSDFIPDTIIFDYGQKFRNISLNDFKTLETIINKISEELLLEDIESENYLLTEENVNDILTIIGFYERLMKKINIEILKIFEVYYYFYIVMFYMLETLIKI